MAVGSDIAVTMAQVNLIEDMRKGTLSGASLQSRISSLSDMEREQIMDMAFERRTGVPIDVSQEDFRLLQNSVSSLSDDQVNGLIDAVKDYHRSDPHQAQMTVINPDGTHSVLDFSNGGAPCEVLATNVEEANSGGHDSHFPDFPAGSTFEGSTELLQSLESNGIRINPEMLVNLGGIGEEYDPQRKGAPQITLGLD